MEQMKTGSHKIFGDILKRGNILQLIFDGIAEPLVILDLNLRVKMLNKAARAYYNILDSKDIIDHFCFSGFRELSSQCEGCLIPSAVFEGREMTFERNGFIDPSRSEKVIIYPLTEGGRLIGSIVRISDITEERLIASQLMQAEKMASLGILVSGIAHEINNPNNFISFNIPILKDYLSEIMPIVEKDVANKRDLEFFGMPYPEFRDDIFRLLDNVQHGSERINAIVSDLKEFSRRRDDRKIGHVDIPKVVDRVVVICRGKIKRLVKTFEVNVSTELPRISTDPYIIEQVLINLLINAGQAADKEDSWIKLNVISGEDRQKDLIIEVMDNGMGMDKDTATRIFNPFFTTKPAGEGTGLGLFVCRNLIEELGGHIEVESEPGKGSTFRVILPDKDSGRSLNG